MRLLRLERKRLACTNFVYWQAGRLRSSHA